MGKGGARHFAKPMVDGGLLYKAFHSHRDVLIDLGDYETLSRNGSPCFEGLIKSAGLIEDVLLLEPSAELHPQPVKAALLKLLSGNASLNTTQFNGQVWINLRAERLCTLLNHVRKAARDPESLKQAALKLCGKDMVILKKILGLVSLSLEKGASSCDFSHPLEKGASSSVFSHPLEKGSAPTPHSASSFDTQTVAYDKEAFEPHVPRILKQNISDVSVDSEGFPNLLKEELSPKGDSTASKTVHIPCKRAEKVCKFSAPVGSKVSLDTWSAQQEQRALRASLGYNTVLKRPASAKETKKDLSLGKEGWLRLQKTIAKSPARSYILGSLEKGAKPKLIVEVSEKRSSQYIWIVDQILEQLKQKMLTKQQALDLRDALCAQHP